MTKSVCFDTQVLIWGVTGRAEGDQGDMVDRAAYLIKTLSDEGATLVVPTLVVAELYMKARRQEDVATIDAVLEAQFEIAPFDKMCAEVFADLWRRSAANRAAEGAQRASRDKIKLDYMIAATAVARKVTRLYTHDAALRTFVGGRIDCQEVPEKPMQMRQGEIPL